MTDVMQIARQRRADHETAIKRKEREIEELRDMITDLNTFLEFGSELVDQQGGAPKALDPEPESEMTTEDMEEEWNADDAPAKGSGTPEALVRVLASQN